MDLSEIVFKIECGTKKGTGFVISKNRALTAFHVVTESEGNEIICTDNSGKKVKANLSDKVTESYKKLVKVTEDDTDPEKWGVNWPKQYDSYKLTAEATKTRYGGHGGSEALPEKKIERDPWLKRMFKGYAFSIDFRSFPATKSTLLWVCFSCSA